VAKKHISYSEFRNWKICPYYRHLTYDKRINVFEGNIYTAFGKALHEVCEKTLTHPGRFSGISQIKNFFKENFVTELKKLPEVEVEKAKKENLSKWVESAEEIIPEIYVALRDQFGDNFKIQKNVLAAEEILMEPIGNFNDNPMKFKGFIDLVATDEESNKILLIDWKTCSWGWNAKKKSDTLIAQQLVFYKYFYCKKHGIDPTNVETYFALLKRTAKKGNKVEFVRVTSGKKRIENALNDLNKALHNITLGNHIKNKLHCTSCKHRPGACEFYKTEHCV
jgi:ATP-dependent exoDNAse (exonuclease V) beta subunit